MNLLIVFDLITEYIFLLFLQESFSEHLGFSGGIVQG